MSKLCDHKSVGMLVWKPLPNGSNVLLLIERKKPPFGFAPPAGHVDDDPDHMTAALRELEEEVGIRGYGLGEIWVATLKNPCRREGGTHHDWRVYQTHVEDVDVKRSEDETKSYRWATSKELESLAERTRLYLKKEISEEDWQKSPGLEPVWYYLLAVQGYVNQDGDKNLPYGTP